MKPNNYANYKDCNIEWCKLIPDDWHQGQLRVCIDFATNGLSCNQTEETTTTTAVSRIETISGGRFNFEKVGHIERSDADSRRLMQKGDLAFSNINSLSMIGNCAILDSDEEIYAGMNLLHIRPKQTVEPKWLYWLMRSDSFRSDVESNSKPAINQASIPQTKLVSIQIPIPQSKSEQFKLSHFLDRETAKIDALIAEQERLIELLQEKRQAVISHAVTKGLNPNAPMKDSGVEWLGQVPEHWAVQKGSRIGKVFGSEQVQEENVNEFDGISFIKVSTLDAESFHPKESKWFVKRDDLKAARGEKRFLAFPKRGAAIFGNKVNLISEEAIIDPNVMGWSIDASNNPLYIAYVLKTRRLEEIADVSTVPQINNKHITQEWWPLPSKHEQESICEFLEHETRSCADLLCSVEQAILLLQERRSALISAAVTGQIDVRGLVSEEEAS